MLVTVHIPDQCTLQKDPFRSQMTSELSKVSQFASN